MMDNGYWQVTFDFPDEKWNCKDADFATQIEAEGFAMQILSKARPDQAVYRVTQGNSALFFIGNNGSDGRSADASVHHESFANPRVMEMINWSAAKSASELAQKMKPGSEMKS